MTHKYIPPHLRKYVVEQDYSLYTPVNQACWRFIMRISRDFLKDHAHPGYLKGLDEFGISTERIPRIQEMDRKLSRVGWGAVCVRGFIPPAAFMELQSLGILAVAADMRAPEHIHYTPAPDIVHEAAGHAPIIADPAYAEYLGHYGSIASKAIASREDMDLYQAIRELSDVKESPHSSGRDIADAVKNLEQAMENISYISEAAIMSRMNWWTVEYGLIGDIKNPKIYGAGLLSSVEESYHCLSEKVKKIPFSIDCINYAYDITEPQPQLFVTPDFNSLTLALEELSGTLSVRRGGKYGVETALKAGTVTTSEFDSGLQISGILSDRILTSDGEPAYIQFSGAVQLSVSGEQLKGHGGEYHNTGFGSPVGKIRELNASPHLLTPNELAAKGFRKKKQMEFSFESGIRVSGVLDGITVEKGKVLLMSFQSCTVTLGDRILFRPEWGTYDMACGGKIVSVFGGPADWTEYARFIDEPEPKNELPRRLKNLSWKDKKLNEMYQQVREMREKGRIDEEKLEIIYHALVENYPEDWLLKLEMMEILRSYDRPWVNEMMTELIYFSTQPMDYAMCLKRGLELINR